MIGRRHVGYRTLRPMSGNQPSSRRGHPVSQGRNLRRPVKRGVRPMCGRARVGSVTLGVDVDSAAATATALLSQPHPLVGAAAGVWHRPEVNTPALSAWLDGLPAGVETGPLPTQTEADTWAREHTLGLIERFPLQLRPDVVLLLASALATRVSWLVPFDLVPATALGDISPWARTLTQALRTPGHPRIGGSLHNVFIASTERAGDVAVHTAIARHDARDVSIALHVTSVIAAPDVRARDVLNAAYDLTTAPMRAGEITRRSLFDLPLGDGVAWTVTEERADPAGNVPPERAFAVLPAWSARNDHDLSVPALGFPAAATASNPCSRPRTGSSRRASPSWPATTGSASRPLRSPDSRASCPLGSHAPE